MNSSAFGNTNNNSLIMNNNNKEKKSFRKLNHNINISNIKNLNEKIEN